MSETVPEKLRSWPAVNEDTAFFWDGLSVGELRIQQCIQCSTLSHPPRPICAACGSFDLGHMVASGRGSVYSHVTFHRPLAAAFDAPYNVSVVELEEGVRIVSQVVGIEPEGVHVDLRVVLALTEVEPGLVLPLFVPSSAG